MANLTYVFCSDEDLLEINRTYLKHDYFTDIITFDLSFTKKEIIGEIYISVDRVRENAGRFNSTLRKELHRVIFHGALHLCGYRDKNLQEQKVMRAKEDEYLKLYFSNSRVPRGTV